MYADGPIPSYLRERIARGESFEPPAQTRYGVLPASQPNIPMPAVKPPAQQVDRAFGIPIRMYPADGGLKEQVRPLEETLSAFSVINDAIESARAAQAALACHDQGAFKPARASFTAGGTITGRRADRIICDELFEDEDNNIHPALDAYFAANPTIPGYGDSRLDDYAATSLRPVERAADADRFERFAPEPRAVMPEGYSAPLPLPKGFVSINGDLAPITSLTMSVTGGGGDGLAGVTDQLPSVGGADAVFPGDIVVTGSLTTTFIDPALLAQLAARESAWTAYLEESLYGPKWKQEIKWTIHNLIAHPVSEVLYWIGHFFPKVRDFGNWLHDRTVPAHAPNTGRG